MFACTRKDRLTARNGTPYLAVELRDRTGAIPGRAFRDADFLASQFERGDLVSVAGRVERFRDELQVEVRRDQDGGRRDPSEFLPVAYRDLERARRLPRAPRARGLRPGPRRLLGAVPERRGLPRRAPARAVHARRAPRLPRRPARAHRRGGHARAGGRACCTRGSTRTCCCAPRSSTTPGRSQEFELGAEHRAERGGRARGPCRARPAARGRARRSLDGFPDAKLLALSHCILAHHGPEALPGRRFRSLEALALYRLNALDAGVKGALEHGL